MKLLLPLAAALLLAPALAGAAGLLAPAPESHVVNITDNGFSPSTLTIAAGHTVNWVNTGSRLHTVTGLVPGGPDSPTLSPGGTYSFTFATPGATVYRCVFHGNMIGVVIVT